MSKLNQKQLTQNYRWNGDNVDDNILNRIFILETKVTNIINNIEIIEGDIEYIKIRLNVYQDYIAELKEDMTLVKVDINIIKSRLNNLETLVAGLVEEVNNLKNRMALNEVRVNWFNNTVRKYFNSYIEKRIDMMGNVADTKEIELTSIELDNSETNAPFSSIFINNVYVTDTANGGGKIIPITMQSVFSYELEERPIDDIVRTFLIVKCNGTGGSAFQTIEISYCTMRVGHLPYPSLD